MKNETEQKEAAELGLEARKLLENPLLIGVFKEAKDKALAEIVLSEHGATEFREHQYLLMKALNEVEGSIIRLIKAGDRAMKQLAQEPAERLHNLD